MPRDTHTDQVENYFDTIATDYHRRYTDQGSYLSYFFTERLYLAARDLPLDDKDILDIGAGTGNLYDYITKHFSPSCYHATDISAAMLAQSNIPESSRYVGVLESISGLLPSYDYIFCLGVTTYMDQASVDQLMAYCSERLHPGGLLIISFTNRQGLDHKIRSLLRPMIQLLGKRDKLLGQNFSVYSARKGNVIERHTDQYHVRQAHDLNLSITGWSRIFPKQSTRLAMTLQKKLTNKFLRKILSSDFLLKLEKK